MNPELERIAKLVEENRELARENNRMIKSLYRGYRIMRVFRFIYIVLIIAAIFGIYYYVEPLFRSVLDFSTGNPEIYDRLQMVVESLPGFAGEQQNVE